MHRLESLGKQAIAGARRRDEQVSVGQLWADRNAKSPRIYLVVDYDGQHRDWRLLVDKCFQHHTAAYITTVFRLVSDAPG